MSSKTLSCRKAFWESASLQPCPHSVGFSPIEKTLQGIQRAAYMFTSRSANTALTCNGFLRSKKLLNGSSPKQKEINNQEPPRQTKPKKGPKRKVHEFRPCLWILVFFLRKTSTIHIELLFRNAPAKSSWSSWTDLFWFGLPGPLLK